VKAEGKEKEDMGFGRRREREFNLRSLLFILNRHFLEEPDVSLDADNPSFRFLVHIPNYNESGVPDSIKF
jgi:hypothetical protein